MSHLGGYIEGGDPATYYPDLWRWLVTNLGVKSVLDVGCGEGHALKFFREQGTSTLGVDGVPQGDDDVYVHDYTTGRFRPPWVPAGLKFDLVWSCEFVEHVEERYVPNFLHTFKLGRIVLMTHAFPGQLGYHHVNCQNPEYWEGAMAAIGYRHDETLTQQTRGIATMNTDPYNHYARSGLAFRRNEE